MPTISIPAAVKSPHVLIADIYHGDSPVDFHALKAAGAAACYIKASQGAQGIDPAYTDFVHRARSVGLLVGAYHFFDPHSDPVAQAKHFMALCRPLKGDLIPCIDSETDGLNVGPNTLAMAQAVCHVIGKMPVIYSGDAFYLDHLADLFPVGNCPRWIARYSDQPPRTAKWDMWQFSETGHVAGEPHPMDLDVFEGTLDQFKARFVL